MAEDLENDKWIKINIGLAAYATGIVKAKKEIEEYAKELGWEVKVDKKGYIDEDGNRMFNIDIAPKGEKISPEELRENREIIEGFAISVLRDVIYANNPEKIPEREYITYFVDKNENKKDTLNVAFVDVFIIECELKKAIKLELQNPNLFKKAFGIYLREWYEENRNKKDKIFLNAKEKEGAKSIVKILEDNGFPKTPEIKKSFIKKLF